MKKELLKTKAYSIFCREIESQLDLARNILDGSDVVSQHKRSRLAEIFHTLKGSAGFFGFEEIYRSAANLEAVFKGTGSELEKSSVLPILETIAVCSRALPAPQLDLKERGDA